jgi:hypothetical protein
VQFVKVAQTRLDVAEGAVVWYCSEVQLEIEEQMRLEVNVGRATSNCAELHVVAKTQTRSDVKVGATASKCVPAAQVLSAEQERSVDDVGGVD